MATREYRASAFGFVYLVLILVILGGYWTEFKELVFPSPAEPEAKYSSVIVTRDATA